MFTNEIRQVVEPVSLQDREVLVVHLLRSPKVIAAALNKFKPEHFNQPYEDAFRILWAISSEYFVVHGTTIPRLILDSQVLKYLAADEKLENFRNDLMVISTWAYNVPQNELADTYTITSILQPLIDERIVMPVAANAIGGVASVVQDLNAMYNSTRVDMPESTKLFDLDDPALNDLDMAATPSGCLFFDTLLGGIRKGHTSGILAPIGGGKTTAAISTAVALAKQRRHAVIFQYEQSVSNQLRPRIWSAATGLPGSLFTKQKAKDLPPELRKAISDNAYFDQYLKIYDMTKPNTGNGGALEIDSILSELQGRGELPELVVIDWLGLMVQKYAAASGKDLAKHSYSIYKELLHSCNNNIAIKYSLELLITHQLNADAGKRGPNSIPTMYDAADFKHFATLMNTCILICRMDENKIARVYMDKNRGNSGEIFIQLRDDVPIFDVQTKELRAVTGNNGRVVFVDNSNLGQGWE